MERLILFRHAKAERAAAGGGDRDRALTERGHADARRMGRWLAARGEIVDLALVSPARRTRETWDGAAEALPGATVEYPPSFYAADLDVLLTAADAADARSVVVVGHNPGVHELALRLAQQPGAPAELRSRVQSDFPTAAVAIFARGADGALVAEAFQTPAQLGDDA